MDHLIGPKTWDRNCRNFGDFGLSVTVQKLVGLLGLNKLCLGVYKIGNG